MVGLMAKKITEVFIDDLTGAEIAEGKSETLAFALEGQHYVIDLGPESANGLRSALTPYIAAARNLGRSGAPRKASSSAPTGEQSAARAWLIEQGVEVPSRGRLATDLIERYRNR